MNLKKFIEKGEVSVNTEGKNKLLIQGKYKENDDDTDSSAKHHFKKILVLNHKVDMNSLSLKICDKDLLSISLNKQVSLSEFNYSLFTFLFIFTMHRYR